MSAQEMEMPETDPEAKVLLTSPEVSKLNQVVPSGGVQADTISHVTNVVSGTQIIEKQDIHIHKEDGQ